MPLRMLAFGTFVLAFAVAVQPAEAQIAGGAASGPGAVVGSSPQAPATPAQISQLLEQARQFYSAGQLIEAEDALGRALRMVQQARVDEARARMAMDPVRIGGDIRTPQLIRRVAPEYPDGARSAGVQGIVILEVMLDPSGAVVETRVARSKPMLDEAAQTAVRQWRYTPTLVDGVARSVLMMVTVNFTLR